MALASKVTIEFFYNSPFKSFLADEVGNRSRCEYSTVLVTVNLLENLTQHGGIDKFAGVICSYFTKVVFCKEVYQIADIVLRIFFPFPSTVGNNSIFIGIHLLNLKDRDVG